MLNMVLRVSRLPPCFQQGKESRDKSTRLLKETVCFICSPVALTFEIESESERGRLWVEPNVMSTQSLNLHHPVAKHCGLNHVRHIFKDNNSHDSTLLHDVMHLKIVLSVVLSYSITLRNICFSYFLDFCFWKDDYILKSSNMLLLKLKIYC